MRPPRMSFRSTGRMTMKYECLVPLCVCAAMLSCREEEERPKPTPAPTPTVEAPSSAQPKQESKALSSELNALRRAKGDFVLPTEEQASAYEGWLSHLSYSIDKRRLPVKSAPDGFRGTFVDGGRVWLLAEKSKDKRGAGALALRVDEPKDVVVQAPHTFFDQGTLPLALTVFDELEARALMINTIHRAGPIGSSEERAARVRAGKTEEDLAHQERSYFQLAHRTLVKRWKDTTFVQLHGFRDEQVPGVSVIVSAAGTKLDPLPVAKALNDVLGAGAARVYPEEVKKLGGTTNVQAQHNKSKERGFLHLELSTELRKRMERQESLRRDFAKALARALLLD